VARLSWRLGGYRFGYELPFRDFPDVSRRRISLVFFQPGPKPEAWSNSFRGSPPSCKKPGTSIHMDSNPCCAQHFAPRKNSTYHKFKQMAQSPARNPPVAVGSGSSGLRLQPGLPPPAAMVIPARHQSAAIQASTRLRICSPPKILHNAQPAFAKTTIFSAPPRLCGESCIFRAILVSMIGCRMWYRGWAWNRAWVCTAGR